MSDQPVRPDQLAPHSVEAEEALLGSILIDPEYLPAVLERLQPDDFFIVRHAWVWEAITRLAARGDGVDYATVVEELKAQGRLEEIGGAAYITYLVNHTPSSLYAGTYAALVARAAYRRQMLSTGSELARLAHDESEDVEALQDQIEATFDALRERLPAHDDTLRGSDALCYYADAIQQRVQPASPRSLSLPWPTMARFLPGVKAGKVLLFSGFSGQGKTIGCEEIAEWAAVTDHRVFYCSTELSREDMLDRMTCRHTGMPYQEVISPNADAVAIIEALRPHVEHWIDRLTYWETNGASAALVVAQIERAIRCGCDVIIIDYLSEAIGFKVSEKRTEKQAIDNFFRYLHTLARRKRVTIVVATQLRPGDHGPHVYGSGVPNDKSAVHMRLETEKLKESRIYSLDDRLVPVKKGETSPMMKVIFEKNTFGATGTAYLFRDGRRFRFLDESDVSYTTAYSDQELETADERVRQAPIDLGWEDDA